MNWIRQRAAKKAEKKAAEENLYTRWEQDKDLQTLPDMGLFSEYLEMGVYLLSQDCSKIKKARAIVNKPAQNVNEILWQEP